eukprot:245828_1
MFDNISAHAFYVGQKIKARDPSITSHTFYNATITEVKHNAIKVKYDQYIADKYDKWIQKNQYNDYIKTKAKPALVSNNKSKNIEDTTSIFYVGQAKPIGDNDADNKSKFYVGQKIKAIDPSTSNMTFYDAKIKTIEYNRVKVKYDKWADDTYDQWIQKNHYDDYIKTKSKPTVKKKKKKIKKIKINDAKMFDNISAHAFYVGQKIQARDPSIPIHTFYNATITEVKHNAIKVKYDQ